ncbi:MAG: glycosyltransferase family 2 protein [Acidimicrobiales bacterium]
MSSTITSSAAKSAPRIDPRSDPEITLLVPDQDVSDPEVSIVVPSLNEQITVETFVAWCLEGLAASGTVGEILIVDSSTDATPELARAAGARVLRTPKRGLGRAYIDALPFVRGKYIVMGDADCTYDFRLLKPFVEKFREGYEFVMGSRWKGSIEKGAMPPHHQYFGTPLTTWILNRVYSSKFSDIHCGMRGITKDALTRMDLASQSWEYASEMVLKSVHLELKTGEVPVRFLKDPDGRVSHHRRMGWFSPFQAAWINLRAMFVYGADFFVYKPGLALLSLGLVLTAALSGGPISVGPVTFSLTSHFIAALTTLLGLQFTLLGCVARVFFDYTGRRTALLLRVFRYTRASFVALLLGVTGVGLVAPLLTTYFQNDMGLPKVSIANYLAISGLLLIVSAFSLFVSTLLIHGAAIATGRGEEP